MSKDLKIFKICDHKINEEEVQINEDRKTIRIPRTLASQQVDLWINGYLFKKDNSLYPWSIEEDDTALLTQKSKIVFKKKRKSLDDFYIISYFALPNLCPKCFGLKVLNDTSYSKLGFANMVVNEEKLLQEVKKGLTTQLGSNSFHEWIGTLLHKLVGSKIFNVEAIRSNVVQEVSQYLEKYLDQQTQQARFQEVTDRESFLQALVIDMFQEIDIDPSLWTLTVVFQNRTGADMIFEKKVELPGPNNLLFG